MLFHLHNALNIAQQVFTKIERYHNLPPIPLHHRFIRACLYFHPNVTSPIFHSDYRKYLQLAFEVLKAAHDILHRCPDAFDPAHANQLHTESYPTSVELIHVPSTVLVSSRLILQTYTDLSGKYLNLSMNIVPLHKSYHSISNLPSNLEPFY